MRINDLTYAINGAAMEVHTKLGPGLLESAYEACLCHELHLRGIPFQRQVPLPLVYKDVKLDCAYRLDLTMSLLKSNRSKRWHPFTSRNYTLICNSATIASACSSTSTSNHLKTASFARSTGSTKTLKSNTDAIAQRDALRLRQKIKEASLPNPSLRDSAITPRNSALKNELPH